MSTLIPPIAGQAFDLGVVLDPVDWPHGYQIPGIVLSNPCDLRYEKSSFLLLAALIPAREALQQTPEFKNLTDGVGEDPTALSRKQRGALSDLLTKIIQNREVSRYYFLSSEDSLGLPPLLVDFQQLISLPPETLIQAEPIARLRSPDREKLLFHFCGYTSRVGVDRLEGAELQALVQSLADPYSL